MRGASFKVLWGTSNLAEPDGVDGEKRCEVLPSRCCKVVEPEKVLGRVRERLGTVGE